MSVTIRVLQGDVRAKIAADGTVTSFNGTTIGFINGDGSAGDMSELLLGEIDPTGKVTNCMGKTIGYINEEKSILTDVNNKTFITISEDGRMENGSLLVVGTAKPYRPYLFRIISSYLWFFDPAFALNGHFSLVTGEPGKVFQTAGPDEKLGGTCLVVNDARGSMRAQLTTSGEVRDSSGALVGFINHDGTCGDVNELFLGEIKPNGDVSNKDDVIIGIWTKDRPFLQIGQEIFPNITANGEVKTTSGELIAQFQLFTPKKAILAAAYLYFFDLGLLQSNVKSLVPIFDNPVPHNKTRLERKSVLNPVLTPLEISNSELSSSDPKPTYSEPKPTNSEPKLTNSEPSKFRGSSQNPSIAGSYTEKNKQLLEMNERLRQQAAASRKQMEEFKNEAAKKAEQLRLESERIRAEQAASKRQLEIKKKEQADRMAAESQRMEQERKDMEAAKLAAEKAKIEAEKAKEREQLRVEQEKQEALRLEEQRLEAQRVENERLEAERLQQEEQLERERILEAEKAVQAKLQLEAERAKVEEERLEQERLEQERFEQERLERERLEAEMAAEALKAEAELEQEQQKLAQELAGAFSFGLLTQSASQTESLSESSVTPRTIETKSPGQELIELIQLQLKEEMLLEAPSKSEPDSGQDDLQSSQSQAQSETAPQNQNEVKSKPSWKPVKVSMAAEELYPGFVSEEITNVAIALYDYTHTDPSTKDFFCFNAGDRFYLMQSGPELQGWKIARNARGEKGFVPGNYLQILPDSGFAAKAQPETKVQNSVLAERKVDSLQKPSTLANGTSREALQPNRPTGSSNATKPKDKDKSKKNKAGVKPDKPKKIGKKLGGKK